MSKKKQPDLLISICRNEETSRNEVRMEAVVNGVPRDSVVETFAALLVTLNRSLADLGEMHAELVIECFATALVTFNKGVNDLGIAPQVVERAQALAQEVIDGGGTLTSNIKGYIFSKEADYINYLNDGTG